MNDFECATPILNVRNLQASMDYYVHKLGFEKKWDWGDPPDFGCVRRGKVEIFLCEGSQGQPGMWMSIFFSTARSKPALCADTMAEPLTMSFRSRRLYDLTCGGRLASPVWGY